MAICRPSYRLYTLLGIRNFTKDVSIGRLKNTAWTKMVMEDTFMPLVCWFVGHKPYMPDKGESDDRACRRCHAWLD